MAHSMIIVASSTNFHSLRGLISGNNNNGSAARSTRALLLIDELSTYKAPSSSVRPNKD